MAATEIEVKVPHLAESVSEAVVLKWRKLEGQYVKKGDVLLELETDKVIIEIPSDANGLIKKIKTPERTVVHSGQSLVVIEPKEDGADTYGTASTECNTEIPTKTIHTCLCSQTRSHRLERYEALSGLRKNLIQRLLRVHKSSITLTTFNEVNMCSVIKIRDMYKHAFTKKHGIKLGLTSFFVKAVSIALKKYPILNASIKGDSIVYHEYQDIGVAINTPLGLIVPILRNTERMNIRTVEKSISNFMVKAIQNRFAIEELRGGTFTVSNGGIFGSLLSTPVLNPPQASILGIHSVEQRPIVLIDKVEVKPMLYLALSYDHRLIDGKEAVSFLRTVKEALEDPIVLTLDT
ncbi:2-oxo acid dehydrogenase subunit E2 [Candidatus Tremblaya phenacola]|uniref:Dihydrolipoamide acetyltransferase component of pyruvate dehydrogenase complex n=1 Tax=Candidatus Tremblayella phenacoccinincola TaxID=1010676 RepID=A0A2G0V709_9PROT|nr:2-oxo acid dehydrogenase subunit E2 [Candidatus Tremblaya phenacola]PHN16249.1 Dihydrolipoyllysine-residue succinyltransferase component of 2-oxoglutarate dehydrogenase complex [Candidatus Tremblaya phenacola]